jgi:hypothetical protein
VTSADLRRPRGSSEAHPFSLRVYLLIVVILSWPFQIAYVLWGFDKAETPLMSYGLSSLSRVMVAVGTFVAGRYVFRDGFAEAGWGWGRPRDYAAVFGLVALVWVVPTVSQRKAKCIGLEGREGHLVVGGFTLGVLERTYGVGHPHRSRVRRLGGLPVLQRGEERKLVRLRLPARRRLPATGRSTREQAKRPLTRAVMSGLGNA